MTEQEFVERVEAIGGRVYLVGGAVRDQLRGVEPKDRDYCLTGVVEDRFIAQFPDARKVGNSFPVFLVEIGGEHCEVAFARRERKVGSGYRGFDVNFDPTVAIEDDLYRRDTTINAIAIELPDGNLIDPFNGAADIADKKIRAVSKHFVDDPVRALRAARHAAEFKFEITPETIVAMHACADELSLEPGERIFGELRRALETDQPSRFFRALERADLLSITFPELHQLIGQVQPVEFHPEGDSFEHAMKIVDDVSSVNGDVVTRFCALVHDIGKGVTPQSMLPHHYKHDKKGVAVLHQWERRMPMPRHWIKAATLVIEEHMRAPRIEHPGKIVDLLMKIHASVLPIEHFNDIIRADNLGQLPPYLEHADELIEKFLSVDGSKHPPTIKGAEIGAWVRGERIKIYLSIKQQEG
ncbi:MAG: HD domain-containing protein [Selenomonadaceae bacterium]|nr:HD domain-containing protein [Selenomonadaceae bacterium]